MIFSVLLLVTEYQRGARMPRSERAAGAVRERDFAVPDLPRSTLAAQLFGGFNHQKNPAHPRMVRRESAAVGVDWKFAVEAQPSARDERPPLAALAEAEILERRQHGDCESV